jgi:cysteine desulfurase
MLKIPDMIDLDANATTPLDPRALEAMLPYWASPSPGNPSSAHTAGRRARQALEDSRERIAALLHAEPSEVVFTSGATEANNLAIFGLLGREPQLPPANILATPIEHSCVVEPLRHLEKLGHSVHWLGVNELGIARQADFLAAATLETRLAVLMLANHETGALQPVRHVAKTLPKRIALHCDAAQAVGKIPVDFQDLGVATLSASAHKFHGPRGVGFLLVRKGIRLAPQFFGGHQQQGRRPGTEPVALIVGMAEALQQSVLRRAQTGEHLRALKLRLLNHLADLPIVVNGPDPQSDEVLPGTLNLSFLGQRSEVLLMKLDLLGVACSTGSACSSGSLLTSPVIQAMHVSPERQESAMRLSFNPTLTEAEIDEAAQIIRTAVAMA